MLRLTYHFEWPFINEFNILEVLHFLEGGTGDGLPMPQEGFLV